MIRAVSALLAALLWFAPASAQRLSGLSAVSPYTLNVNLGELAAQIPNNWYDASGLTYQSVASPASSWAVVITIGQSLASDTSLGTYTTANAGSWNFNLADRGVYNCTGAARGTQWITTLSPSGNNINCQIADLLINGATYTHVIMAPAAVAGSACANWGPGGALPQRIATLYNALAARKLTKATGFPGDVWILWHQGEQDNANGTTQAAMTTCLQQVFATFASVGFGTSTRIFVATESLNANTTSTNVTNAEAAVVASGCTQCRAGMNVDSFSGPTYRQSDGTHPTAALAAAMASGDVTVIQNCKATSC